MTVRLTITAPADQEKRVRLGFVRAGREEGVVYLEPGDTCCESVGPGRTLVIREEDAPEAPREGEG